MPGYKKGRLGEDIKRELAVLMRELKDPRVTPMLSIVRAEVSNDGTHCKAFISSMDGMEAAIRGVEGLKSASGLLRRELTSRLKLRKAPALVFVPDDSIAHSAHMSALMRDMDRE